MTQVMKQHSSVPIKTCYKSRQTWKLKLEIINKLKRQKASLILDADTYLENMAFENSPRGGRHLQLLYYLYSAAVELQVVIACTNLSFPCAGKMHNSPV